MRKPYALARSRTGVVYVTEAGELSRPTGTIRRMLPDGGTSVVPLRPPPAVRRTAAAAGRVVDVLLEIWALFVVTGIAGSFASFFASMDRGRYPSGTSQTTPRGGSVTSTE